MIVVDATVLAPALVDEGPAGTAALSRLAGQRLTGPHLVDLEVLSVVRRLLATGALDARRAGDAVRDLVDLPLPRAQHQPLLARCWELRDTMTAYDASYVALAEALDVVLVTADARLSRAPGARCDIELVG